MKLTARILGPALAAGVALPLILAAPAAAQSAVAVRYGSLVVVNGIPGQSSSMGLDTSGADLMIFDNTTGITAGPGCSAWMAGSVRCGPSATVSRISVSLGDQDDQYNHGVLPFPASVNPGPGKDNVLTGPGSDTVSARDGEVDLIHCGGGFDLVTADVTDIVGPTCEFVRRS